MLASRVIFCASLLAFSAAADQSTDKMVRTRSVSIDASGQSSKIGGGGQGTSKKMARRTGLSMDALDTTVGATALDKDTPETKKFVRKKSGRDDSLLQTTGELSIQTCSTDSDCTSPFVCSEGLCVKQCGSAFAGSCTTPLHIGATKECTTCDAAECCLTDCVGDWSDWGACPTTCGGGVHTRMFEITTAASNGGIECEHNQGAPESQSCNVEDCPGISWYKGNEGQTVTSCGDFCAARAGTCHDDLIKLATMQPDCVTQRTVFKDERGMGYPCVKSSGGATIIGRFPGKKKSNPYWWHESFASNGFTCETVPEKEKIQPMCPCSGDVLECTDNSGCNTGSVCSNGLCVKQCGSAFAGSCTAPLHIGTTKECSTCDAAQCCVTDCVGDWSDWSTCPVTCGGGVQTRTFEVTVASSNGGLECPTENGVTESQTCNAEGCPGIAWFKGNKGETVTSCGFFCAARGGTCEGDMIKQAAVEPDCATQKEVFSAERSSTYPCIKGSAKATNINFFPGLKDASPYWYSETWVENGGFTCETVPPKKKFRPMCPCSGGVSECTANSDCGTGMVCSEGLCVKQCGSAFAGSCTTPLHIGATKECTTCDAAECCLTDCVGDWTDWGACPTTCGGGVHTRTYVVTVAASNGGLECPHNNGATEQQTCNPEDCPGVSWYKGNEGGSITSCAKFCSARGEHCVDDLIKFATMQPDCNTQRTVFKDERGMTYPCVKSSGGATIMNRFPGKKKSHPYWYHTTFSANGFNCDTNPSQDKFQPMCPCSTEEQAPRVQTTLIAVSTLFTTIYIDESSSFLDEAIQLKQNLTASEAELVFAEDPELKASLAALETKGAVA